MLSAEDEEVELLVVGGGPAGLGAAIEASRRGISTLLVEDHDRPGGQLFKQIHKFFGSHEHYAGRRGYDIGKDLLAEAESVGVRVLLSTKVLGVFEDDRVSILTEGQRVRSLRFRSMVVATGGIERSVPIPGWTLPGVITAGAAQTFCNVHRVLPGERVVMLGSGNVGLIVAYQLLQAGADVLCLVESKENLGGYQVHGAKLLRAGVPILTRCSVTEVRGVSKVQEVVVSSVDDACSVIPGTERVFAADTLCLAVGLLPNDRLASMGGCGDLYSPEFGSFVPLHDSLMASTRSGVFVAGDCAGVEEANTALDEGRAAGISAACFLGRISEAERDDALDAVWGRLDCLRSGSFGERRRLGVRRILASASSPSPLSSPPDGGAPAPMLGTCADSFLLGPDAPPVGRGTKAVAIIRCDQDIPCDPCVASCPVGAITMAPPVTGLPVVDSQRCVGCGRCLAVCPGQAISLFQEEYGGAGAEEEDRAALSFVYEYYPTPEKGQAVEAVDRFGSAVCSAKVEKVVRGPREDRSAILTISFPRRHAEVVRFIKRLEQTP